MTPTLNVEYRKAETLIPFARKMCYCHRATADVGASTRIRIPQGWQWVDPQKEFNAMKLAIRAGLMSRSEAISAYGYDAEDVDREIAADNQRADALGLVFDSDPRHDKPPAAVSQSLEENDSGADAEDPTSAESTGV